MNNDISLNKFIDHTLLKADATNEQIQKLCDEAAEHNFATVCLNPCFVSLANELLKETEVGICTVIGFPLGATHSDVKAFETKKSIELGANEVDMVINIGALKNKQDQLVQEDIEKVVKAADGVPVKVIIETALLNDEEKKRACQLAKNAKASFVKTSTGFSTAGATIEDIKLMKKVVGNELQIKASGGVRDRETALAMIQAGASRLGTSSGINLIKGEQAKSDY